MSSVPLNPTESVRRRNPSLFPSGASPGATGAERAPILPPAVTARGLLEAKSPSKREKAIHADCLAWIRSQGWLALHGTMARRTGRTLGEPDMILLLPAGRVLFVEIKTDKGRLSESQIQFKGYAETLGHVVHIVRSVTELRNAVNFGTV